jgi:hypothetical protein
MLLVIVLAAGLLYGYMLWQNNRLATVMDLEERRAVLENSIRWLDNNREKILSQSNPMLWYMIQHAARINGDARLKELFSNYEERYLKNNYDNLWRTLFYPNTWVSVRYEDIRNYPYYNQHFFYGLTCDEELGQIPSIAAQNDPAFCNQHRLRPACVTHQLMGIRLLQRSKCGDQQILDATERTLENRIFRQLTWDPRQVDVYIQRVLMLAESAQPDVIKPIWLRRIAEAQLPDGGWGALDPLLPLGGNRYIGFDGKGLSPGKLRSNFHATAQGVLLFSILVDRAAATES